jgi:hypothetical protein
MFERTRIFKATHNLLTDVAETFCGKPTTEEIKYYGEVQSTPGVAPLFLTAVYVDMWSVVVNRNTVVYNGEWALNEGGAISMFVQPHSLRCL